MAGPTSSAITHTRENISINKNVLNFIPTVTSISPLSGAPGASITVTGTHFSTTATDNTIYFGAAKGTVTNATSTSLQVNSSVRCNVRPGVVGIEWFQRLQSAVLYTDVLGRFCVLLKLICRSVRSHYYNNIPTVSA
ncbi:MAG: IPT/TIG domain-containing protein [Bacteroidota bacterium]